MNDSSPRAGDFRLPASVSVFELKEDRFDLVRVAAEVEEAILAEDRFRPIRIEGLPDNAIGFAYYGWRTSPYLSHQFFPEWTLGLCVLVRHGSYLFANDTGGIVFEASKLGLSRADGGILLRALPEHSDQRPVRVCQLSLFSLDTSERAIRTMATRTRSFADVFTDLLDPVLVPTSASGFVDRRGRYVGLLRGRITDAYPEPLDLNNYCAWVEALSAELRHKDLIRNHIFGRYALVRTNLSTEQARPLSILLDFDDTFSDFLPAANAEGHLRAITELDYEDLCSDIDGEAFTIRLRGNDYRCEIRFFEGTQRYRITSDELDQAFPPHTIQAKWTGMTLTGLLNRSQAFRVIINEKGVIYAKGKFFEPNLRYETDNGHIPILDDVFSIPALAGAVKEKGETIFSQPNDWRTTSVFGILKAICETAVPTATQKTSWSQLHEDLSTFEIIVCDDDQDEIGDFLVIDPRAKRVAIIHAKASEKVSEMSVRALQEVGRQVLSSLAFCSAVAREAKIKPGRWDTKVNANGVQLDLNRTFRNEQNLTITEIEDLASRALADRSWTREIWIIVGCLMCRKKVVDAIRKDASDTSNRAQQFLMYLESLTTTCARANSRLRIYCH